MLAQLSSGGCACGICCNDWYTEKTYPISQPSAPSSRAQAEPYAELRRAAAEQMKITELRLAKLFSAAQPAAAAHGVAEPQSPAAAAVERRAGRLHAHLVLAPSAQSATAAAQGRGLISPPCPRKSRGTLAREISCAMLSCKTCMSPSCASLTPLRGRALTENSGAYSPFTGRIRDGAPIIQQSSRAPRCSILCLRTTHG